MDATFDLKIPVLAKLLTKEVLVEGTVIDRIGQDKVFDAVVRLVAVTMMDLLLGTQRTAEVLFHDKSMLENIAVTMASAMRIKNDHISLVADVPAAREVRVFSSEPSGHRIAYTADVPLTEPGDAPCVVVWQDVDWFAATALTVMATLLNSDPGSEVNACHNKSS